jgi:hypothetical protein
MNHILSPSQKNAAGARRHFVWVQLLLALALLIGDTAAGLAGGLAGSLAFAATAILRALTQIAGLDGLDVFHNNTSIQKF